VKTKVDASEPQSVGAGIGPNNYADDAHLARVTTLLEENTRHTAEKAEEWRLEAEVHAKIYIDLASDDEA
jgi:hypothetical protein